MVSSSINGYRRLAYVLDEGGLCAVGCEERDADGRAEADERSLLAHQALQGVFLSSTSLAQIKAVLQRFGSTGYEGRGEAGVACLVFVPGGDPEREPWRLTPGLDAFEGVGPTPQVASLACLIRLQERIAAQIEVGLAQMGALLSGADQEGA
jgi:hypothetical protein